jgi:hypothetical protein
MQCNPATVAHRKAQPSIIATLAAFANCAVAVSLCYSTTANAASIWSAGDLTTYTQVLWPDDPTARNILIIPFNTVYASTFGVLEVGIPGASGYSMRFDSGVATLTYLPANGTSQPLVTDLFDPTTSASGAFGGDVVALKLNVDYSDAKLLPSSRFVFGDLIVGGTGNPAFDGETVRELLASMNVALGGGPLIASYTDLDALARDLNAAFASGTPSAFAQDHLSVPSVPSAVPEPGTWTTIIAGLSMVGGLLRAKKQKKRLNAHEA